LTHNYSQETSSIRQYDDGDEKEVVLDTIEINREDGYNDDNVNYQEYADVAF
jgi:hypothetical protein